MAKTKKTPAYVDKAIAWLEKNAPPGEKIAFITPEEAALLKSQGGSGKETVDGVRSYMGGAAEEGLGSRQQVGGLHNIPQAHLDRDPGLTAKLYRPVASDDGFVSPYYLEGKYKGLTPDRALQKSMQASLAPTPTPTPVTGMGRTVANPVTSPGTFPNMEVYPAIGQISVPKPIGHMDLSVQDQLRIHPDLSLPTGKSGRHDVFLSGRYEGLTHDQGRGKAVEEWRAGTLTVPENFVSIPSLEALGHVSGRAYTTPTPTPTPVAHVAQPAPPKPRVPSQADIVAQRMRTPPPPGVIDPYYQGSTDPYFSTQRPYVPTQEQYTSVPRPQFQGREPSSLNLSRFEFPDWTPVTEYTGEWQDDEYPGITHMAMINWRNPKTGETDMRPAGWIPPSADWESSLGSGGSYRPHSFPEYAEPPERWAPPTGFTGEWQSGSIPGMAGEIAVLYTWENPKTGETRMVGPSDIPPSADWKKGGRSYEFRTWAPEEIEQINKNWFNLARQSARYKDVGPQAVGHPMQDPYSVYESTPKTPLGQGSVYDQFTGYSRDYRNLYEVAGKEGPVQQMIDGIPVDPTRDPFAYQRQWDRQLTPAEQMHVALAEEPEITIDDIEGLKHPIDAYEHTERYRSGPYQGMSLADARKAAEEEVRQRNLERLAPKLPMPVDPGPKRWAQRLGGAEAIRQAEQTSPPELGIPLLPAVKGIDVPEFGTRPEELISAEGLGIAPTATMPSVQQVSKEGVTPAAPSRVPAATIQAVKAGDTGQALAATQAAPTAVIGDIQETIPPDELAQAATADLDQRATVQYQLAQVTSAIKEGQPLPSWAAPAARNADALMLQRGLGASSMAAAARTQALIEAGLPIASADAQSYGRIQLQNLNNEQQAALQNANMLAAMRTENLNARMTAAVNNARNFLALDTVNLNNEQASNTLTYNAHTQKLFNDQAAENAAKQFNATSTNQVEQFFATLEKSVEESNANRITAINQYNAGETNAYNQYLANQELTRAQFNNNQLAAIRAANANWFRSVSTINNGNQMAANSFAAQAILGLREKEYNALWQKRRDDAAYIFTSVENDFDRIESEAGRAQAELMTRKAEDSANTRNLIGTMGSVMGGVIGASDIRLKTNIEKIGSLNPVIDLYRWEWNEVADDIGISYQPTVGVLAQELIEYRPDLVHMGDDGYFRVNYGGLFA